MTVEYSALFNYVARKHGGNKKLTHIIAHTQRSHPVNKIAGCECLPSQIQFHTLESNLVIHECTVLQYIFNFAFSLMHVDASLMDQSNIFQCVFSSESLHLATTCYADEIAPAVTIAP